MENKNTENVFDLEVKGFRVYLNEDDNIAITQGAGDTFNFVMLDKRSALILAEAILDFLVEDLSEKADKALKGL